MVRITHNLMTDRTLLNLQKTIQQVSRIQQQLSTGHRIEKASDDSIQFPVGLGIRSSIHQTQSYLRNIDGARSNLELTETTLGSLTETVQSIRTLALQGSNSIDPEARQAIARQIEELYNHIKDLSNTNYNGQYIFGGSQSKTEPFAMGNNSITYKGDDYQREVIIGKSNSISMNVPGSQVFLHTPNQITSALSITDRKAPLADQLRLAHPDFPNLPKIPERVPGAAVDASPNPGNYPGKNSSQFASFYVYDTEIKIDLTTDTLEDVRDRINAKVKDVTASINDKNQLVITSRRSDALVLQDGPRNIGFPPDTPQQANILSALGMHSRVEGSRSLTQGFPSADPLSDPTVSPTPTRSTVRVQNDSFLFASSNVGPYDHRAVPFADNLAITNLDRQGKEALTLAGDPQFIHELEAIRITIDDEAIDVDLRALTQGYDFDGVPGNGDDIPGSTLEDLLGLINNHPLLQGKATAYINADRTGIGITAVNSTDVFKVESVRKLFGRDLTMRVSVDENTGSTTLERTGNINQHTLLNDVPGALIDPATGSLGIRRPNPMPAGTPPSTNEGFIVIGNNGNTEAIDLREAATIGDVIRAINESKTGVRAEINESKTGINIVSINGHDDTLSVTDMADGTIARDLGLFRMPSPAAISSNTGLTVANTVAAELPTVSDGEFTLEVRDSAGRTLETYTVPLSTGDTIEDIIKRIDAIDGAAGPGKGLISAHFSDLNPPAGPTLNIVSNYNGHSLFINPENDTTGSDNTTRFTQLLGIDQFTSVADADAVNMGVYTSGQDTAGVLGIKGNGKVNEIEERNIFRTMDLLIQALRRDDTEGIKQALGDIDLDLEKVLITRTALGARINRLDATQSRLSESQDFMKQDLSKIEDADLAQMISDLTLAQNAFNAALSSSSKMIQQSLLDFLR